jgi:hypothetical protein
MKTCELCSNSFPFIVKINGKKRNLKSRKYCLSCSPFGNHNTKKLLLKEDISNQQKNKKCLTCGKELISNSDKKFKDCCGSCRVSKKRKKYKEMGVEYKGGYCIVCGYKKCTRALHFHHLDPSSKDFTVSSGHTRSWEKMKIELDKCVLLCSNCHSEVHENLIDLSKYI